MGLPRWLSGKESANTVEKEMQVQSLGQKYPLEEEMAPYSSTVA